MMTPEEYMRKVAEETFAYYREDPSRRATVPSVHTEGKAICVNLTPDGRRCAASRIAFKHGIDIGRYESPFTVLRTIGCVGPIPGLPDTLVEDLQVWHDTGPGESWFAMGDWATVQYKDGSAEAILQRIDAGLYGEPKSPAPDTVGE